MSGRRYRVVERFPWIEGGAPIEIDTAPGWKWEGGKDVIYEPGDIVYIEDGDLPDIYHKLEAIDEAGRVVLEEIGAEAERPANHTFTADLDAEQRSFLAWGLAQTKMAQGEGPKEAILWAIRNGAKLPDDLEERAWIADALEGKVEAKRTRGRPKKRQRGNSTLEFIRAIMEAGMVQAYHRWLADFQRDRRARRSPAALKGATTPSELAREATAREYKQRWKEAGGGNLTSSAVARIVTRANKSD